MPFEVPYNRYQFKSTNYKAMKDLISYFFSDNIWSFYKNKIKKINPQGLSGTD